ncbi:kinase-like domain-containing protein [Gigaspora rosea]|uniref:Kinase-like domain-containing protein n=1 Tax=Gigaspora rosea TaxID=44941 RepID=A0A397V9T9_9GLOM|nr:kinase-like domain-containing protein [Gigaspora rosea]
MDSDFLTELKNFVNCKKTSSYDGLQQYHGITQHPETKNYIMVIEFAQNRDLHYFLNKTANTLSWIEKLSLLQEISRGLNSIHKNKFIHRDLHSRNVLIEYDGGATIADLGISKPVNELSDNSSIYGVIPNVAPEVLNGGTFTQASDIYSFGMIVWEVISGCRPFYDQLVELMERCWHQDPEKRNFSRSYKSEKRINYLYGELDTLINKAEKGKIKFTDNKGTKISPTEINDQAFYSSRPLTPLISKALTLQSMRLNSNVITDIQMVIM